ncbi:MAG TPA: hypothetical protein VF137_02410 [Candidatus Dormibacteraeota bacterium]
MPDARRRTQRAAPPAPGLTDLIRGPLDAMARMSGIDRATRSLERLATSADRAAKLLDTLDAARLERLIVAGERAAAMLDRLDGKKLDRLISRADRSLDELDALSRSTQEMNESLKAIERFLVDTRAVLQPLDRLPLPRALRRRQGSRSEPATQDE